MKGERVISIEEWGPYAAVTGCEVLKVKNQHDSKKLIKIKKSCYNKGFYQGVMQVGSQKGTLVQEAKPFVRKEMLDEGTAAVYWEPEGLTISRSGDECIVAFIDQWYITYGEETWRDTVMGHVQDPKRFNAYTEGSLKQYVRTLNWLGNWACSRNFGLQIDGHRTSALVPYADMLNHYRPRETKWTFDDEREAFTITT